MKDLVVIPTVDLVKVEAGTPKSAPGKLLPCPFCGDAEQLYPAYRWPGSGKPYVIDCLRCGFDFTPREGMDVLAMWNRRAP